MDIFQAAEKYIVEMTTRKVGMKALLLDEYTTAPVSMVYSHSDVLQNEIYLLSTITDRSNSSETFDDVDAIVFVRPCRNSLMAVDAELRAPRFAKYDICFSGAVDPEDLERLAAADVAKKVSEVTEYYLDYLAVDRTLFTFNTLDSGGDTATGFAPGKLEATSASLLSVTTALNLNPAAIRFQGSSNACRALAERTARLAGRSDPAGNGLLLILDRRSDPITPLLNQWTYQAMLHELLGIRNGTVAFNTDAKKTQFLLSSSGRDPFFDAQKYTTYDVLLPSVDRLVAEYRAAQQEARKLDTIEDMKKTLMDYSRHKERGENAVKHSSLVLELKRIAESSHMLGDDGVGLLEQELVKVSDQSYAFKSVARLIQTRNVRAEDKVRLTALFMLRFEGKAEKKSRELLDLLTDSGVSETLGKPLRQLCAYCGTACPARSSNVFKAAGSGLFKSAAEEAAGDMLRHTPLLATTLNDLVKGKLSSAEYPTAAGPTATPKDVVVFFVGGVTYAEARVVHNFNVSVGAQRGIRVLIGGTFIHNLQTFLEEVTANATR